ncbi:hypothetical protein HDU79_009831 [Rhizoclosmatium sp. JEL0117]|nr:hypothetical protein HDU79_009831 [Rhizoclosmatium sp. JEL0117]
MNHVRRTASTAAIFAAQTSFAGVGVNCSGKAALMNAFASQTAQTVKPQSARTAASVSAFAFAFAASSTSNTSNSSAFEGSAPFSSASNPKTGTAGSSSNSNTMQSNGLNTGSLQGSVAMPEALSNAIRSNAVLNTNGGFFLNLVDDN